MRHIFYLESKKEFITQYVYKELDGSASPLPQRVSDLYNYVIIT